MTIAQEGPAPAKADPETTIACGGLQVRPGDIVGADGDGCIVVPVEVAHEVATHARAILLADMNARRKHYAALGLPGDGTIDIEAVEAYYAGL
jgi:4-hydroxy-4-methyl-2-oxoglutarate aldolase